MLPDARHITQVEIKIHLILLKLKQTINTINLWMNITKINYNTVKKLDFNDFMTSIYKKLTLK